MPMVLVAIHVKLVRAGAPDIDVLVSSRNIGSPSPCDVVVDFGSPRVVSSRTIGGSIASLDEILQDELVKQPGYVVKYRSEVLSNYSESGTQPQDGS